MKKLMLVLGICFYMSTLYAQYTLTNNDVVVEDGEIISCSYEDGGDIIIPDVLDGQVVMGINATVFEYKNLTGVVLPSGLKSIGFYAFYGNNLKNIVIPNGVESISYCAFAYNQIESVLFPNGLLSIADKAFYNNIIVSLELPENINSVGNKAFSNNKINSLVIKGQDTYIKGGAFSNNRITHINGLESNGFIYQTINDNTTLASYGGLNTNNIIIPDNVEKIADDAFDGVYLYNMPEMTSVRYIGHNAISILGYFTLPEVRLHYKELLQWVDSDGNIYEAGEKVESNDRYTAKLINVIDCHTAPQIKEMYDNVEEDEVVNDEAIIELKLYNNINPGGEATYRSTNTISFEPGFEVMVGGELNAIIVECMTNKAPTLNNPIENKRVSKNEEYTLDLNQYFSDPNDQQLSFLVNFPENECSISSLSNGILVYQKHVQQSSINITATDPGGLSISTSMELLPLADAGSDFNTQVDQVNMMALPAGNGMQAYWSVLAGNGQIVAPDLSNTSIYNLSAGVNIFSWTVIDGEHTDSDNIVVIYTPNNELPEAKKGNSQSASIVTRINNNNNNNMSNKAIQIFPNPASDIIKIGGIEDDDCSLFVYSLNGTELMSLKNIKNNQQININWAPKGTLIFRIFSHSLGDFILTKKILVE